MNRGIHEDPTSLDQRRKSINHYIKYIYMTIKYKVYFKDIICLPFEQNINMLCHIAVQLALILISIILIQGYTEEAIYKRKIRH